MAVICGSWPLSSQTLLRDFNDQSVEQIVDSRPGSFVTLGTGEVVFTATSLVFGTELWVTGGSAGGTRILADLEPGPGSSNPQEGQFENEPSVVLPDGRVLFVATTTEHGSELWTTDGTTIGTQLLVDLYPGPSDASPGDLTLIGNEVFFVADDGVSGHELWKTDGSTLGTTLVLDGTVGPDGALFPDSTDLIPLGSAAGNTLALFFESNGILHLWSSDGTSVGTFEAATFSSQGFLPKSATLDTGIVFSWTDASGDWVPWVSDGTSAGTQILGATIEPGAAFASTGMTAYFLGTDALGQIEIWATDGTALGTRLAVDLIPNTPGLPLFAFPSLVGVLGEQLVFGSTEDGFDADLYVFNPALQSVIRLGEVDPLTVFGELNGTELGGQLYFAGSSSVSSGVWRTDGTTFGTRFIGSELRAPLGRGAPALVAGEFVACGFSVTHGEELYVSDGTPAGTNLLADINVSPSTGSSNPTILGRLRDRAILAVDDGAVGTELWITDGTVAGTALLGDLTPGVQGTEFGPFASNGLHCVFVAEPASGGRWLGVTLGTPASTQLLDIASAYPGFEVEDVAVLGELFLLSATDTLLGGGLWISDGTLAGTQHVLTLDVRGRAAGGGTFTVVDGLAYFLGFGASDGFEPWVTDGTLAGTQQLADVTPGPDGATEPSFFANAGFVVLTSGDGLTTESELWGTDGTSLGTQLLADLEPGSGSSSPRDFVGLGERTLFLATVNGSERIGSTDGTALGTQLLPLLSGTPQAPIRINRSLAIVRVELFTGELEVWHTDGLSWSGPFSKAEFVGESPANVTDDTVVWTLDRPLLGRELWQSDGTQSATEPVFDLSPGSSNPEALTRIGDRLVFVADDYVHGTELFAMALPELQDESFANFGYGSPGTGGLIPSLTIEGEADTSGPGFSMVVRDAYPNSVVAMLWSRTAAASPLFGATLFVGGSPFVVVSTTDATGHANLPVSPGPTLAGVRFVSQAFVLDPAGSAFAQASASPALEVVLGP